jgi:hypothetical protein
MSVRILDRSSINRSEYVLTSYIVDWADLATLDLSQFDQPGGKERLATQLFDAIQKIGKFFCLYYTKYVIW